MIKYIELNEIVKSNNNVKKMIDCAYDKLAELFGKEFADMKDFNQNNPHHCYDLLNHTVQTVLSISDVGVSDSDFTNLRVAALFHDIGKPQVAFEKNGRTVFYGHAEKSAEIAKPLFVKIGYSPEQSERICFFIEYHDTFISFKPKKEIFNPNNPYIKEINLYNVEEKIKIIQRKAREESKYVPDYKDFNLLMNLCVADASAQSNIVTQAGKVIDSKASKIERLNLIRNLIKEKI